MNVAASNLSPCLRRGAMHRASSRAANASVGLVLLAAVTLAGCSRGDLETEYGKRSGKSVNGTGAFADLMRQSGYRVATWKRFSPKLNEAELLVWFHDEYDPPSTQQREFVERWMSRGVNRTLVFVGRDFDGEAGYWRAVEDQLAGEDWVEARRRMARARLKFDEERSQFVKQPTRWFTYDPTGTRYRPRQLTGPWGEGVDAQRTSLELQTKLAPPREGESFPVLPVAPKRLANPPTTVNRGRGLPAPVAPAAPPRADGESGSQLKFTPLLQTERGDVVAMRVEDDATTFHYQPWNGGRVIVVANGSFLLNVALANRENRKLAQRLVDECGTPRRAVFLESSGQGLPVFSEELEEKPNGFELFRVWPLNVLLGHLVLLGILYCLARFPIFGRPKRLTPPSPSDFGKHVLAIGELLEKTHQASYAKQILANYHATRTKDQR